MGFATFTKSLILSLLTLTLCFLGYGDVYGQAKKLRTEGAPLPSLGAEVNAARAGKGSLGSSAETALGKKTSKPIQLNALNVDKTFESMDFDDNLEENDGFLFIPPDPIGAAGKSRLIAIVNSMIEARNKGGKMQWREGLQDFFAPLSALPFPFDPKIVYDHYEDRFVVVALERDDAFFGAPESVSRILLAVSKDGNPKSPTARDWHYFAIDSKFMFNDPFFGLGGPFEYWADYPGFEIDEEAIYITANLFSFVTDVPPFGLLQLYGGSRLWIVDKGVNGGFYEGDPADVSVHDPYADAGLATTTMPALVYGDGGAGPGVGTYLVSYSGLTDGADEYVQVVRVDDPLGTPSFTQAFVNVGDLEDLLSGLPDAPQAGTDVLIEVNDRRALDAVWRDGSLWFTTTIEPNAGSDAGQTTAHWFKLETSGADVAALEQQGDISGDDLAPNTFTFYPAVTVNREGAALFGFSASAPTIFAGAFVTGRQPGDPAGTVRPAEVVHEGEAPYKRFFSGTRNRWGDYSGIALDPTNEDFAWVFNEYAEEQGTPTEGSQGYEDGRWGTAWGRAKFTGHAGKVLAAAAVLPEAYALEQNYPNPFNPSTTIQFALPEDSEVQVAVFDVLGRQVRVLANGPLSAGEHQLNFEASDLPSGVYFLRMITLQGTFTRSMQLMK